MKMPFEEFQKQAMRKLYESGVSLAEMPTNEQFQKMYDEGATPIEVLYSFHHERLHKSMGAAERLKEFRKSINR